MTDSERGDDVYQPQEAEASDPNELLGPEDTLDVSDVTDLLDAGYSPPERPWAVDEEGTTAAEQHEGESLDRRLTRELPDVSDADEGPGDLSEGDGELWDAEVGVVRAGRLTQQADGGVPSPPTAQDVGIDGAAASAEEAAMHVVDDDAEPLEGTPLDDESPPAGEVTTR
ncbi:DUF5709 domain-containing protein [Streptomyces fulvorobeus]|uniref:DUF5709 domain-containing protein n=1 Tax=Streptomyces fulvorobeus TaxID=284028 RepID=A0A7J0CDR6_9ACTN|nr:DUF5709 domain-containing protein [Streptomyces fulvorobeus]NYE44141.1 hypothetical protein [Streptomyces fulvorobeus]GFN00653.1 hypothetical protein Sfulv_54630 [Streptomyces fulvorobeus]